MIAVIIVIPFTMGFSNLSSFVSDVFQLPIHVNCIEGYCPDACDITNAAYQRREDFWDGKLIQVGSLLRLNIPYSDSSSDEWSLDPDESNSDWDPNL